MKLKSRLIITPENIDNFRESAREDMMSWQHAFSTNVRRLDVLLVLVTSAIFYDTTKISDTSYVKIGTQVVSILTIALSILDYGYARFTIPKIISKSQQLWILFLNIKSTEITEEFQRQLNLTRDELDKLQQSFLTPIRVTSILEIIFTFLAVIGELILRMGN